MKKNLTELVFILDKSGSMSGLEKDTIGGFNSLIAKQKKEQGEAYVSTILFSTASEVIHDRQTLEEIKPMTDDDYIPGGCTALFDAVGDAIHHIGNIHKYAREEDVPAKTMFVITTDGMENASKRYSRKDIKKLIEKQKEKGWEFLFLGANIDAAETAESMGIERERAANYKSDKKGTSVMFRAVGKVMSDVRCARAVACDWSAECEEDAKR